MTKHNDGMLDDSAVGCQGLFRRSIALVLAGGQSRRMGKDKLSLAVSQSPEARHLEGETILEHVLKVAGAAAGTVWILTPPSEQRLSIEDVFQHQPNVRCLADHEFYQGPLAALGRAWSRTARLAQTDARGEAPLCVFVVAGDLPGIEPHVLQTCRARLLNGSDDVDAVLTEREGMLQPLLGCYRPSAGQAFEAAFANGDKRLLRAIRTLRVSTVSSEEEGWSEWLTRPVHTPEDYQQWLHEVDRKSLQ